MPTGSAIPSIISILAAIALPAYQDYISKTQLTRVVGELAAAKTAADAALFNGKVPAFKDDVANKKENIGLSTDNQDTSSTSPRSNLLSKVEVTGFSGDKPTEGSIKGTLGNAANKDIHGTEVSHIRDSIGVWKCEVDKKTAKGWKEKFIPTGCTAPAQAATQ